MNRQFASRGLLVARAVLLVALMATTAPGLAAAETHLGVNVAFDVDPENGTFTATAEISDLASGQVLSAPRITGKPGQEAVARSAIQTEAGTEELRLTVSADEEVATYRLELIRGGEVVSVLRSTVRR